MWADREETRPLYVTRCPRPASALNQEFCRDYVSGIEHVVHVPLMAHHDSKNDTYFATQEFFLFKYLANTFYSCLAEV
jgi:hypothetical protein